MKLGRMLKITVSVLFISLITGLGLFLYNANHSYDINNGFIPIPLKYNPEDSSSKYDWNNTEITVYNGFVKGIQKTAGGSSLVVRALSPMPIVELKALNTPIDDISITIENISPEFYAKSIEKNLNPARIALNALRFTLKLDKGEERKITPVQPNNTLLNSNYVILGDSRDGYETFGQIISQVNALDPAFAIDNGDLVYSGKPNQYRVFDRMASRFSTTLCTTLGNHDIRGSGLETYTKLYGPGYYSFDFGNSHFAFLDSSPGWSQKQAISDPQYAWLERDLKKAQGKTIYVITHIPPEDPRDGTKQNSIPYYTDKVNEGDGFFEQKLDQYSENKSMDHGFQDKQEAERFENLMEKYDVDTVYLSHIHSYFDYNKNNVRYIISGGAGAELLTKNSYYHFLITKTDHSDSITMVQLPSPANVLIKRYFTTVALFAEAMYVENRAAAIFFVLGLVLLVFLMLLLLFNKLNHRLKPISILIKDTIKYMINRYKELFVKTIIK